MRIAQVSATFPPYVGGTGNVCYHNARVLAARGHTVHVFTTSWPGVPCAETMSGITVRRLAPSVSYGNASVLPQLLWLLRGYDVIHCHCPNISGAELAACAAALHRIPMVVTYHNDLVPTGSWRDVVFRLATWSGRQVLQLCDRVLFVSEGHATTNDVRSVYRHRSEACQILRNGVDTDLFLPATDKGTIRSTLGLPVDGEILGFVGSLDMAHHYKGLNVLLEALASRALQGVHLLVVGDGELKAKYQRQADDLGLAKRVHFHGQVPQSALPPLYQACDVIAFPSLAAESFGLVVAESFACAVPVVAFASAGIRSVASDGVPIVLVEPGDTAELALAVRSLLDDDARRCSLGWQGRREVQARYGWDRIGQELEEVYTQVVRASKQKSQRAGWTW